MTLFQTRFLAVCTLALLAVASPAWADAVSVGCPGGAGTYPSITDALNYLRTRPSDQAHQINVSGACSEYVKVERFFGGLTIQGPATLQPGAGPAPHGVVMLIINARVTLRNMTLRGAPDLGVVQVGDDANVRVEGCTVENGRSGIVVNGHSSIVASTIQNNSTNQIGVNGPGAVYIGSTDNDTVPTVIKGGFLGVAVNPGGIANIWGATTIKENSYGVYSHGGNVFLCCNAPYQRKIIDNNVGIRLNGGTLNLNGDVLIENNRQAGIQLRGGTVTVNWVSGQTIRRNGTTGMPGSGGILVQTGASLRLLNAEVSENRGSGIVVQGGSSAMLSGTTIRNNGRYGVEVIAGSTAEILSGTAVSGNVNTDLFCAPNSYAFGDKAGIGKMICPTFDQSPNPLPDPELP